MNQILSCWLRHAALVAGCREQSEWVAQDHGRP